MTVAHQSVGLTVARTVGTIVAIIAVPAMAVAPPSAVEEEGIVTTLHLADRTAVTMARGGVPLVMTAMTAEEVEMLHDDR